MTNKDVHKRLSDVDPSRRKFIKRFAVTAFVAPVIASFALDGIASADTVHLHPNQCHPNQHWPNQHWPNQHWPNQHWPNQNWPNQYCPNQYWPNQHWPGRWLWR
jgi:hypothetical protein